MKKHILTECIILIFRELKHQPNAEVMFEVEHKGNVFNITTDDVNNTKVQGSLGLFINDVDFSKPVEVYKEGKLVFKQLVQPNVGAMADALSLWCDPLRMFPAKIIIPMKRSSLSHCHYNANSKRCARNSSLQRF